MNHNSAFDRVPSREAATESTVDGPAVDSAGRDATAREATGRESIGREAAGRPLELDRETNGAGLGALPTSELDLVWERVRRSLQERIRPEQFHTWFKQAQLRSIGGGDEVVTIAVQNNFTAFFIKTYYMEQLADALRDALGEPRPVDLVVDAALARDEVRDAGDESTPRTGLEQPAGIDPALDPAYGQHNESLRRQPDLFDGGGRGARPAAPAADHGQPAGAPDLSTGGHSTPGRSTSDRSTPDRAPSAQGAPARAGQPSTERRRPRFDDPGTDHPRGRLLSASDVGLHSGYRFENFVVGPCNRFAHAASVGVSESPGQTYNPLFLHGNVGLGKTHLIQSLCHSILDRDPGTRILYLSCESFVNHFVDALDKGDLQRFRNKYRNVDVLVVDDIHLLANKERTQEEFFHTFNTLYNAGKQIVLSSDSPPKDIPTLQSRLVSRFKWGLVTEIETPCYETRRAILKRKSREKGNELPDDVASDLAEAITANIRELEGAVTRLLGYAALSNQPVTVALARECLRDLFEHATTQPTIEDVLRVITSHFQIRLVDLQSRKRTHAIAFARQVGMYLARKLTRLSLQEIGGHFGGRDHSTVLYAVERIKEGMQKDAEILETVRRVEAALAAR